MSLNSNELARKEGGAVECRSEAVRLNWAFTDLAAADHHALDCRFACSVRIADNPADRRMFAEVFLISHEAATLDAIAQHFSRALRGELSSLASQSKAADAVAGDHAEPWIAALTKAMNPIAFAAGLEILAPFQLDVESPTLQRQKLEEVARARAEHRTASQLQQLKRAGELLDQFQSMRQAAPGLSAGKLLEQLNPSDRGLALQTMLLASSGKQATAKLWAVAGTSLVRIDPRVASPMPELIELPDDLGPLRSVQPATINAEGMLLIGARAGVIRMAPLKGTGPFSADPTPYPLPDLTSALGFNRVVCDGEHLWASHSEAGIVRWMLEDPGAAPTVFAESGPRNLELLDDSRLIYSIGNELIIRCGDTRETIRTPSSSEIVAIVPTPERMIAVHADGTLVAIDRTTRQITATRNRGTSISAAAGMPWLGDVRLLLATDQGQIDCVGMEDPLVTEYLSPYRGLKIVCATADLVAAVSPDRQRVIIWQSWEGQRPLADIHVTSIARHRVADVEFGEGSG